MTKITNKKQKLTSLVVFILSVSILSFMNEGKDIEINAVNNLVPKSQVVTDLEPLIIDNTGGGNFTWDEAKLEEWCSGLGTVNNPYIVKSLYIDGNDNISCFEIRNSNVSAIIQDCEFTNAGYFASKFYAGIKLVNVSNVQIVNNTCLYNNGFGMFIVDSNNIILEGNQIEENGHGQFYDQTGIVFDSCHYSQIIKNSIVHNGFHGILLDTSDNNILIENDIVSSGSYGIMTNFCNNNTIYNNTVRNNSWAIGIYTGDYHNVSHNKIVDSVVGVFCQNSDYNNITNNQIRMCTTGIGLLESDYNSVLNNLLEKNKYCIEQELCVGNIITGNNCGGNSIPGYEIYLLVIFSSLISSVILIFSKKKKYS